MGGREPARNYPQQLLNSEVGWDKQLIYGASIWYADHISSVLIPDKPIQEGKGVPIFVTDCEMAQLSVPNVDFGQMIAELYAPWPYKGITAGLWMMRELVDGYGVVDEEFAFRTALQTGAHLPSITIMFPG